MPRQQSISFGMRGGMNVVDPAFSVLPGQIIGGVNYEYEARGIRRGEGYERYDGQGRPSAASFWKLGFDAGTTAISEGDVVTGATSGATGTVLEDATVESGSWVGNDAAGYIILTAVTGTFQDDENLEVSASPVAVADGTAGEKEATNDTEYNTWIRDAIATQRALINKPTGSGAVRGVAILNGDVYCIRDNAGATAGVLYKATTSGWSAQSLGSYINFDAGTAAFQEGETLTGVTSGATATIMRIVVESGAWGDTDADGFLCLSGISGTFQDNETITGGTSSGSATSDGTVTAWALPAGGHYDFTYHSFYGAAQEERMYGCQGEGKAFEWDGTTFAEIRTGLSDALEKPIRIQHFKNHLFLGYAQGTVNFSEIGEPLQYSTTGGAGTFYFGASITDFPPEEATALLIFGESQIGYVTGSSSADFELKMISHDAGAIGWTVQAAGDPTYLDNAGIRSVSAAEAFGDWRVGTLSKNIEPVFETKRKNGYTAAASLRVRHRDQYRLFFNDGTGVTLYLGRTDEQGLRGPAEPTTFELDHTAFCAASGRLTGDNRDSMFIGTTDGWVMEMDRGTSFDGESVFAWFRCPFLDLGQQQVFKRWSRAVVQIDAPSSQTVTIGAEFDYSNDEISPAAETDVSVTSGGGYWDDASTAIWDEFVWSAPFVGEAIVDIDGYGRNASIVVISDQTHDEPHTVGGMSINFSMRGMKR